MTAKPNPRLGGEALCVGPKFHTPGLLIRFDCRYRILAPERNTGEVWFQRPQT
jgi:hypothetical protein